MVGSCFAKHAQQTRPTITSRRASSLSQTGAREILDSLRLSLPTVAPGQTPGALRFVSLALHILPQKGGRHRRNVSARKVSEPVLHFSAHHPETHFSIAPLQAHCAQLRSKPHSTLQAWMYSRNQTTIASCCKHRQPVFLHPNFRTLFEQTFFELSPSGITSHKKVGRAVGSGLAYQWDSWIASPLADSAPSLYTTSFPIQFDARPAHFPRAARDKAEKLKP